MMVKNKTNKNYKRSQKGRSMVEMLGVLSIIGVLSVGGVYGYGVAMKKHEANEALHKASLMATTISSYALNNNGNLPQNKLDFANLGYDTEISDNGTQFVLTMKAIDPSVCTQMKKMAGGMVQKVECVESETSGKNDAQISYYKNLATNDEEGENSSGSIEEKDETGLSSCTASSSGYGEVYGGDFTNQVLSNGNRCRCWNDFPVWNGLGCVERSSDIDSSKECNSANPCDVGEYCRYRDGVYGLTCYANASGYPVDGKGSITEVRGWCEKVVGVKKTGNFYYTKNKRDWFSAKEWCAAIGKQMVSLSDLGCSDFECSDLDELTAVLGDNSFWTTDMEDDCQAITVQMVYQSPFLADRSNEMGGVICR
jgi:type II secretory pathway pseudopilin PulG